MPELLDWVGVPDGLSSRTARRNASLIKVSSRTRRSTRSDILACLKLSLACALEEEHKIAIDFRKLLHPRDRGEEPKGRRRYASLSKLGKTFVTTNYDGWLDEELPEPVLSLSGGGDVATAAVPRVFEGPRCTGSSRGSLFVAALGGDAQALEATRVPSKQPPSRGASTDSEQSGRRVLGNCRG